MSQRFIKCPIGPIGAPQAPLSIVAASRFLDARKSRRLVDKPLPQFRPVVYAPAIGSRTRREFALRQPPPTRPRARHRVTGTAAVAFGEHHLCERQLAIVCR